VERERRTNLRNAKVLALYELTYFILGRLKIGTNGFRKKVFIPQWQSRNGS
jgi:hypothetical protein